jgi:translocation and assembly module TamB
MSDKVFSSRVPARWRWAVSALGVLLAALAGLGWLGGSESGLRVLCSLLTQASAGRLHIEAPGGSLLGDWTAQSVRWRDGSLEVDIRQLSVVWSPRELLGRHLAVERIDAASVRVFFVLTSEPIIPPDSLRLPVSAKIGRVAIGRVLFGKTEENAVSVAASVVLHSV